MPLDFSSWHILACLWGSLLGTKVGSTTKEAGRCGQLPSDQAGLSSLENEKDAKLLRFN